MEGDGVNLRFIKRTNQISRRQFRQVANSSTRDFPDSRRRLKVSKATNLWENVGVDAMTF